MMLHFVRKHENRSLINAMFFQAVIFLSVFTLFFYSVGFGPYHAIAAGLISFFSIAFLFKFFNLPFFIFPHISGPVYVPSPPEVVKEVVKVAGPKKGEKSIDIGSGDGRVVIAMAKAGADALGIELSPHMVELAEKNIDEHGVKNAKIQWKNFWDVNFSAYDIVTIYGFPSIMEELGNKLRAELKPGARVVSYQFEFPGWKAAKKVKEVYLYTQGSPKTKKSTKRKK